MKQLLFSMAAALCFHAAVANGPVTKGDKTTKAKAARTQPAAKPFDCTGQDKKLINGVCETGTRIWTRSEWDNVQHIYRCYYYYRWSDNSTSPEYFTVNPVGCIA